MLYNKEYYNKNSKVVWYPDRGLKAYICFRKTFEIEGNIKKAEIKTFANSKYVLYINGQFVKRGIYPHDEVLQQYDNIRIDSFLKNGKNVIGFICAPSVMGESMLFAEIDIELNSGEKMSFAADRSFKSNICKAYNTGNLLNACDYSEIFDGREYREDWLDENFDDSNWFECSEKRLYSTSVLNIAEREIKIKETVHKARAIVSAGSGNECSTEINLLRQTRKEIETVKAGTLYVIGTDCEIKPLDKGYFSYILIDVDKDVTGFVKLDVTGYNSDVIDVCFAKELKDGIPVIDNVARFVLEDGNNVFETRFTENSFRYMFIIFRNYVRADKVNDISVIIREPDLNIKDIYSDDKDAVKSMLNCVSDYLYNPYKMQDFQSGMRIAKAIFASSGNTAYLEQLFVTFLNCQNGEGLIPEYAPSLRKTYNAEDTLDIIHGIHQYYELSKDKYFLLKVYNKVLLSLNWFLAYENDKCLLENVKYNDEHTLDAMLNIKYLRALKAIKEIASILSEKETFIMLSRKIARVNKSIMKEFYNKTECFFVRYIDDDASDYISKNVNAVALDVLFEKKSKKALKIINSVFVNELEKEVHTLSSYYIGEFANALKRQKSETLIEKEICGRDDYIANCSYIENK